MSARQTAPTELAPAVESQAAGLASEPWSIALVAVLWIGSGLGVAWRESRRGHDIRSLVPLGIAFGPLLLGFARTSLRSLEATARPVVLRRARAHPDQRRVVVAVLGSPDLVADVRPFLHLVATDPTTVELARPVTFDAARGTDDDADRRRAACALEDAALFVHDLDPDLVLIPGRGLDAVARFLADTPADLAVVVDDDGPRGRSGRAAIEVFTAPSPDIPRR